METRRYFVTQSNYEDKARETPVKEFSSKQEATGYAYRMNDKHDHRTNSITVASFYRVRTRTELAQMGYRDETDLLQALAGL